MLPWVEVVHSLDSLRLAEEIDLHAGRAGKVVQVLMQVNASGERSKQGVAVGAATHLVEQIVSLPNLKLLGMMTMAPLSEDGDTSRRVFARMREIFEEIAGVFHLACPLQLLDAREHNAAGSAPAR